MRRSFRGTALYVGLMGSFLWAPVGCSSASYPRAGSPPAAPKVEEAREFIPRDLEVVLRADLKGLREIGGGQAWFDLVERARSNESSDRLLRAAIDRAHTAWLGFRPGRSASKKPGNSAAVVAVDSVLVLEGHFASLDVREVAGENWWGPQDLGGLHRVYQRRTQGLRGDSVRVYAFGSRILVFASVAEVDAVERLLREGPDAGRVEPVAEGLVSVAARPEAASELLRGRAPESQALLSRARASSLTLTRHAEGLLLSIYLDFTHEARAQEAKALVQALLALAELKYPELKERLGAFRVRVLGNRLAVTGSLQGLASK